MDNAGVASGHYENFPVASLLCPPAIRTPVRCIYAFARTADDIADEGTANAQERMAALSRYRQVLRRVVGAPPTVGIPDLHADEWPHVFRPLCAAIREFDLPAPLLEDLLDAFEQDTGNPVYASREQLLNYCRRSANPIGRLLLHLYGIGDAESRHASDSICTALQLINFWQDLSVDLPRGRNYLPADDCERHGLRSGVALSEQAPAARALVRELVQWSAEIMADGARLPLHVPGRAGWELRLVVHGGWRILEKIRRMDYRSFLQRPRLHAGDVALLAWRALSYSAGQLRADALR